MERMHQEMDRMFSRLFTIAPQLEHREQSKHLQRPAQRTPVCEMTETESTLKLNCELPGIEKKNLQVEVHENSVEIKGIKSVEKEVKKDKTYSYHAASSSFYRSLSLPAKINPDKSVAVYKDGLLTLTLHKLRLKKGHKVMIR